MKWYGSLTNRLEENRMFVDEITVGTGTTEYFYTDTKAYEVVEVKDQKHVTVREYDHKKKDGALWTSNDWDLISNENNPSHRMTRRGKYWYWTVEITADILEDDSIDAKLFLIHNDVDPEDLKRRGKIVRYHRANVSFGKAEYYYDYSF